jgi:hypothetical protein
LREVLEPDVQCLACPPGDAEALAAAVLRRLDDPALAARADRQIVMGGGLVVDPA